MKMNKREEKKKKKGNKKKIGLMVVTSYRNQSSHACFRFAKRCQGMTV